MGNDTKTNEEQMWTEGKSAKARYILSQFIPLVNVSHNMFTVAERRLVVELLNHMNVFADKFEDTEHVPIRFEQHVEEIDFTDADGVIHLF